MFLLSFVKCINLQIYSNQAIDLTNPKTGVAKMELLLKYDLRVSFWSTEIASTTHSSLQ